MDEKEIENLNLVLPKQVVESNKREISDKQEFKELFAETSSKFTKGDLSSFLMSLGLSATDSQLTRVYNSVQKGMFPATAQGIQEAFSYQITKMDPEIVDSQDNVFESLVELNNKY